MQLRQNYYLVWVLALGVTVLCFLQNVPEANGKDLPLDLETCRKVLARVAKRTFKAIGPCSRELKANVTGDKDMFQKKLGCMLKCTLRRMELLDVKGKVTRDLVQQFMDKVVPPGAHQFAHELTAECMGTHATKLDDKQENCESYSSFVMCIQNTLADFSEKTSCHPVD